MILNESGSNINNQVDELIEFFSFKTDEEKIEFEALIIHSKIIDQIIILMEQKKMNRKELAEKIGVSKSYITQLFSGDKLANFKILAKFQQVFDIAFDITAKNTEEDFYEIKSVRNIDFNSKSDNWIDSDNSVSKNIDIRENTNIINVDFSEVA